MPEVVVVHGGAGPWSDPSRLAEARDGCEQAAVAGAAALDEGALDAVVAAVKSLELNPAFNAGVGSTMTRDGTIELDAAVMTGDLRFGAIAACPPVESAIETALALYKDDETSLLAGSAAAMFAGAHGIRSVEPKALEVPRVIEQWKQEAAKRLKGVRTFSPGTVGAVALDSHGNLAAATSTGGTLWKRVGRVGDTPLPGAGTYADDVLGAAASATGQGEAIMKVLLCRIAAERVGRGASVEVAARASIEVLKGRAGGMGGIIIVNKEGNYFAARNTGGMPWAACIPGGVAVSGT